jgi:hypothetical protein
LETLIRQIRPEEVLSKRFLFCFLVFWCVVRLSSRVHCRRLRKDFSREVSDINARYEFLYFFLALVIILNKYLRLNAVQDIMNHPTFQATFTSIARSSRPGACCSSYSCQELLYQRFRQSIGFKSMFPGIY